MISSVTRDGGWCWFQDPRILYAGKFKYVGFVSMGKDNPARIGEIRLAAYKNKKLHLGRSIELLLDGPSSESEISKFADDHNSPALVELPSGRLIAFWTLHGKENCFYTRSIDAKTTEFIGDKKTVIVSEQSKVTYSNPIYLASEGRLYNFFRGLDDTWKPSMLYSDDEGETWADSQVLIDVPDEIRRRPYVKYASDGESLIHFFFTDDHPRSFNNNIYHMVYRSGVGLCDSSGRYLADIQSGISAPGRATRVWDSKSSQTAWVIDAKLDQEGSPRVLFQVREKASGSPEAISYWVSALKNGEWSSRYLASAGSSLYSKEEDYTGLGYLSPFDSNQIVISTGVDPRTGSQLEYWTLFEGRMNSKDAHISWRRLVNRRADCIRPILLMDGKKRLRIYWLEGKYNSYTSYALSVMSKTIKLQRGS